MPTINVNRTGAGTGATSSSFSTARTGDAASVTDGVTGSQVNVVQFFKSSGRGGGTVRFKRVFLHFDTSGITSTLSAAHIDITGHSISANNDGDTILLKSTAFGGDGGTALATTDFYDEIDYSTEYSTELGSFSHTGNNEYTLTAAALADIKANDHFTVAIVEHDADYLNTDIGDSTLDISIAFGTTITLDYTEAAAGYTHDVIGVAAASIGKVNTVATASIGKINSVD